MANNPLTETQLQRRSWAITLGIHLVLLFIPALQHHEKITLKKTEHYQIPVEMVIRTEPPKPQPKPKRKPKKKKRTSPKPKPKKVATPQPISYPNDQPLPTVASSVTPVYPKTALNEGLTGRVVVDFTIDASGKPLTHKIIRSSGHDILDSAFIQTVMRYYSFKPKQDKGKKKTAVIRLDSGDAFEL